MTLDTPHLQLLPFAPAHMLALIDGHEQFATRFGKSVAEGMREFFVSGEVSQTWLDQLRSATSWIPWVHGFAAVHRVDDLVIGAVGFKGEPDEAGIVEIAYGIVPIFQGRGYATEATIALVTFAFKDPRIRTVRAHTLPDNNASTRVLAKCGFESVGVVVDPDDGLVWRWERKR